MMTCPICLSKMKPWHCPHCDIHYEKESIFLRYVKARERLLFALGCVNINVIPDNMLQTILYYHIIDDDTIKFCSDYECSPVSYYPGWFSVGWFSRNIFYVHNNEVKEEYNRNRNYCLFALKHTNWHKLPKSVICYIHDYIKMPHKPHD
jgi:hypothetical protein